MRPSCFRVLLGIAALGLLNAVVAPYLSAADLTTWPSQYAIRPWETSRLTAADVVGPDGITYPDFTGVGVTGGIPDINNSTIRAGYTVYDVTAYGAVGDGVTDDDAPVAAALTAARNNAAGGVNKSILYFPTGTYLLTDPLIINENNVVVDGDGPSLTLLKLQPGNTSTDALITIQKPLVYIGYLYPTANIPRGANTVTFDKDPATNGYAVGTWVRMLATKAGAGKTMSDRYSNPDNNVVYTDALYHFGRIFYAKVTAINSATKSMTFDRTFVHDYYTDEVPEMRTNPMAEYSGVQDLTIETTASTVTMAPLQADRVANCWIKNVTLNKASNWPLILNWTTRFEIRDCVFNGSWTDINSGSQVYLGWIYSTDSLMDNCQANDMRHMPIFQMANRCVVRGSTFTGTTIQSPQLHGRMPLDNLIETSTFTTRAYGSTAGSPSSRGITAYASDGAATLRHGIEGPRNVFYNNNTTTGAAFVHLQGISENLIFAYNRVLKTDDIEAYPSIVAMDRTFDTIIRGNIFQSMIYTPFISMEDPTCTGWSVTDNQIYGSNGYLWEGDSDITTAANNRFFSAATTPPATTTPEVASIYSWQKTNANTARLVLVIDNRTVTDTGGTTTASVVRVKASTAAALTVNLTTDIAGISVPATVTIPIGEARATFTITGTAVSSGEKTVTLTATASGLLADTEKLQVLDQNVAQPNFGLGKMTATTSGLPAGWKARNNGQVTAAGSQSYTAGTDTWSITGAGLTTNSFDGSLYRSGRRFVYATVNGDGEIVARLTATTGESQVGLMIADDEATGTDHIWIEPNGRVVSSGDGTDVHGKPSYQTTAGTKTVPIWLRLTRVGTTFTAYTSTSATTTPPTTWTQLWTKNFYNYSTIGTTSADYLSRAVLDRRMHFGLFINSGSLTTTATATFTGVAITGTIVGTTPPPAAPTAFTANLSGSTATLAWTDNSTDETGFQIDYQIGTGTWNTLTTTAANSTGYVHTNLLDSLTYTYRVKAVRSSDSAASATTATASVSVPLSTLPTAPTGITTTGVSTTQIQIDWTDNAYNESGYDIERSTTGGGSGFTVLSSLAANATTYTDGSATEGARFYYRVRAKNTLGNSAYTAEAAGISLLATPTGPAVTGSSGTETSISWTDTSSAETSFSIRRSTSASGTFTQVGNAAANATTFTDTTVSSGTTYYYQVVALNAVTASAASANVSAAAVSTGTAAFYEPFNFTLSPTTIVSRAGSGSGYSGLWLGIAGTAPRETLITGNLSAGRITGLGNQFSMSQTSANSRIALVLDTTAKAVVTPPSRASKDFWISFLVKTPSSLPRSTAAPALVLSTSGNSQIIRFVVQSGGSGTKTGTQYAIAGTNLTTVSSSTNAIAANTTYCYIAKVTITDTDGNTTNGLESLSATLWQYPSSTLPPTSAPTSGGITRSATTVTSRAIDRVEILGAGTGTAQFFYDEIRIGSSYAQVALPQPPSAPTSLGVSGATSSSLMLTWTDTAINETAYKVQRATAANGPYVDVTTSLAANTTTYTDTGLSAANTYYYRVRATNANGSSDPATGNGTTSAVSVSGTITVGGSGLAGVTVTDGTRSTTTAANGTFTLANVPGGTYTLTPTLASYTFSPSTLAVTVTGAALTGRNFAATFVPSSYTLNGTVTVGGSPLAGATITVGATTVTTAANGTYAIPGLVNGTYTVTASKSGYTFAPASASVTISGSNPSATNFAATLITYSIGGTVTYAGSGLTGVTISDGTRTTTTASNGAYTLTGVPPGDYTLVATKTNYTFTPTSTAISITNANVTGQNFTSTFIPPTTYTLSGVVLNSGSGLSGVTITNGTLSTTTANNGSFSFANLTNGTYTLTATLTGYTFQPGSISATISDGDSSGHTFTTSAPAAPTNLAATPGSLQVALTWSGGTGVSSYTVKRATVTGGPYTSVASGLTATSYTDTGLTNGTTYFYVVSATNLVGESPDSSEASAAPRVHTWAGGAANWSSNVNPGWNATGTPNTVDAFADTTGATGTITVNGTYTLGSLKTGPRTFNTSSGLLIFNVSSGNALLDAAGGSPTLNVDLQLNDNLKVTNSVASGSQTVAFNGAITSSGKLIIENTGVGTDSRYAFSNPANTFAGGIDIGPRTVLRSTASGALGDGILTRTATDGTGSLNFFTADQTHVNDINLGSASAGGTTLSINNAVQVTLSGILSGTMGSNNRISIGGGTLILNGPAANIWTGQLRGDTHGTLVADKINALPGGMQFRSSTVDTSISLLVGVSDTLFGLLSIDGSNSGVAYAYLPRIGLKDGNTGTVTLNNATALNLNQAFGPGGTDLAPTASLILHSGNTTGTLDFATQITDGTNPRSIQITGAGTVKLSRAAGNTYDGTTTVVSGTLLAANTSGSATGTGAVRVGVSGAATTLAATGQTSGSATVTGFTSTASLAVGQTVTGTGIPVGTTILSLPSATSLVLSAPATTTTATASLTFANPAATAYIGGTGIITGNVTLAPGAGLAFNLNSAPVSHDGLAITGPLALGTSPAPLLLTTSNLVSGVYPLVTAAGGITGTLPTVANPSGFTASVALSIDSKTLQLTLTSTQTALDAFRTSTALATDGSQDLLTPAGDGVANLLKYAFNMLGSSTGQAVTLATPNASVLTSGGTAGLPYVSIGTGGDAGKLQITFIRRKTSATPGITYAVEFTDDLASWAVNPSATESATSLDATFERVTVTDSSASPARRFARVKVTTP